MPDHKHSDIWFSAYDPRPYQGPEPPFFDPREFPWPERVASMTPTIRAELDNYLAQQQINPRSYFRDDLVSGGGWRTIPLMTWGVKYHGAARHFPSTLEILEDIPGLVSIAFNILGPRTRIHPHFGDTNASIRAHLGLRIPAGLPEAGIEVHSEQRAWREGDWLFFCDGYNHSAWNLTANDRYILLVDVIRPRFRDRTRTIRATILGSLATQSLLSKLRIWKQTPWFMIRLLHALASVAARLFTPLYNKFGRLVYRTGRKTRARF